MTAIRHLLRHCPGIAGLILMLALAMKVVVPGGFMVANDRGSISIVICDGHGPAAVAATMPGMHHGHDKPGHDGKEMPCAFSSLTAHAMASDDPSLRVVAVVLFAAVISYIAKPLFLRVAEDLRPPLRGPPTRF